MKKNIAIYGGSFNPINNNHLTIAKVISEKLNAKVIFLPVGNKYKKDNLLDGKKRVKMLKLATKNNKNFLVSNVEVKSKTPLFAIDYLTYFKNKYKNHQVLFVMGSDNLKYLTTWKKSEKLLQLFNFIIIPRDTDNVEQIINKDKILRNYIHKFKIIKQKYKFTHSSSDIRKMIFDEQKYEDYIPKKVFKYIERNKLYKNGG